VRTEDDAIKSVQRYFAQQVFAQPWDVRRDEEMGDAPERPYVLVEFIAGSTLGVGTRVGVDVTLAVAVNAYLAPTETRQQAKDATAALREAIFETVKFGPDPRNLTPDLIPLWDYDAATVPVGQATPYRAYCDFMRVSSLGLTTIYDDADPRLAQVTADLRLTYRRGVPVPLWKMAQGIVATGGPEG
jgi:hypothetical protein